MKPGERLLILASFVAALLILVGIIISSPADAERMASIGGLVSMAAVNYLKAIDYRLSWHSNSSGTRPERSGLTSSPTLPPQKTSRKLQDAPPATNVGASLPPFPSPLPNPWLCSEHESPVWLCSDEHSIYGHGAVTVASDNESVLSPELAPVAQDLAMLASAGAITARQMIEALHQLVIQRNFYVDSGGNTWEEVGTPHTVIYPPRVDVEGKCAEHGGNS